MYYGHHGLRMAYFLIFGEIHDAVCLRYDNITYPTSMQGVSECRQAHQLFYIISNMFGWICSTIGYIKYFIGHVKLEGNTSIALSASLPSNATPIRHFINRDVSTMQFAKLTVSVKHVSTLCFPHRSRTVLPYDSIYSALRFGMNWKGPNCLR